MGLSLGRDTKRCAGCQRKGEQLTRLGNGTSYCPACAVRVRKLLGFRSAEDEGASEELPGGEPIIAAPLTPPASSDEAQPDGELSGEPLELEPDGAAAAEEPERAADPGEAGSLLLQGPWERGSEHGGHAAAEPDAGQAEVAATDAKQEERATMEHEESSPVGERADARSDAIPYEDEAVARATARFGQVDPLGDPGASPLSEQLDGTTAPEQAAAYATQSSYPSYVQANGHGAGEAARHDEPSTFHAEHAADYESHDQQKESTVSNTASEGLGSALHEEHQRLTTRRSEAESRIEEAKSEIEAIERRMELVDALLNEESAAA